MALAVLKTVLFSLRSQGHLRRFFTCSVAVLAVLLAVFSSVGVAWFREFRQLHGPAAAVVPSGVIDPRGVPDATTGLRCRQLRPAMVARLGAGGQAVRWHYVADTRNGGAWQVVANGPEYLWMDVDWLARQNLAAAGAAGHAAGQGSVQLPSVSPTAGMAAVAASPMFRGCDAARLRELLANGRDFGQFQAGPAVPPSPEPAAMPDTPIGPAEQPEVRQSSDPAVGPIRPTTGTVSARANLRAGPNTNFAVRDVVDTGTEIVVVSRSMDGQWLRLESGLWIHHSLVALDSQAETGR